jgi:hypothetical protein
MICADCGVDKPEIEGGTYHGRFECNTCHTEPWEVCPGCGIGRNGDHTRECTYSQRARRSALLGNRPVLS